MTPFTRTVSVSPSGRYRVVAKTVKSVSNGYNCDSLIVLCDNKGNFLLNLAPTNQRSLHVLWRRDEKALIVNNATANSGDYLVYARKYTRVRGRFYAIPAMPPVRTRKARTTY